MDDEEDLHPCACCGSLFLQEELVEGEYCYGCFESFDDGLADDDD